jgi:hypothetical protein
MADGPGAPHQLGGLAEDGVQPGRRDGARGFSACDRRASIGGGAHTRLDGERLAREGRLVEQDLALQHTDIRWGQVTHAHMHHIPWDQLLRRHTLPAAVAADPRLDGEATL